MIAVTIGTALAGKRLELGLDKRQAAVIIGMSRTTYTSYEADSQRPSVDVFPALAKFLDISIEELLVLYGATCVVAARASFDQAQLASPSGDAGGHRDSGSEVARESPVRTSTGSHAEDGTRASEWLSATGPVAATTLEALSEAGSERTSESIVDSEVNGTPVESEVELENAIVESVVIEAPNSSFNIPTPDGFEKSLNKKKKKKKHKKN
jgi:DNA-binding XRE family transcriptional regulator